MVSNYLALDVGQARVGLALANSIARIAAPLPALNHDAGFITQLQQLVKREQVSRIVVGWPRSLNGQETAQTRYVAEVIDTISAAVDLPLSRQDEAVTSITAEAELQQRRKPYTKADIDSLSAVYILEDFMQEHFQYETH